MKALVMLTLLSSMVMLGCGGGLERSYFSPQFTGFEVAVEVAHDGTMEAEASGGVAFGPIESIAQMNAVHGDGVSWVMVSVDVKYMAALDTMVWFSCDLVTPQCDLCVRVNSMEVCQTVVESQPPTDDKPQLVVADHE